MRKAFLLTAYLFLTPIVLVLSLSLLLSGGFQKNNLWALNAKPKVAFAALPVASGTLKTNIISQDARLVAIKSMLKKYKSDLLPYSDEIIASADKYNVDYRLVPAIAMQESGGCVKAPKNSHNCWGFAIYGAKVTKFTNYYEAIDTVTKTLAKQYLAKGLETPEQIMTKYTPGSNGSWAKGVNFFMNQLDATL
jgi:hypothetical protein